MIKRPGEHVDPKPISAPLPEPALAAKPKRWPWLALTLIVGVAAIAVLAGLHQREQDARRAEMQATLFRDELNDSVREISSFGEALPERGLAKVLRPVIMSTTQTASVRVARLDALLAGDPRTDELQAQLREVRSFAAADNGALTFAAFMTASANRMAGTANAIARDQHERASLMARETMAGGALAVLLSLTIVATVLWRAQRLLVMSGRRQAVQLQELAEHDPLTGLANRRRLAADLAQLSDVAVPDRPVQVMICDLDGFKALNDSLGHDAGDDLLVRLADHLEAAAGDDGEVYRLGGDEFCVLSHPGHDVVAAVLETLDDPDAGVRGSAGLALWPGDARTARDAMRVADARMYDAKAARRHEHVAA